jgi:H+/Cl- antiporter ClcA
LALIEDRLERYPLTQPLRATLGGALVGAIAIGVPEVAGNVL